MTGETREPERIIARLRPHARALVLPSIVLVGASGATAYGASVLDELWQRVAVAAAGFVAIVALWLVPYVRWLGSHVLITTRRIVIRRGLAVRTRQELLHGRTYDVVVRQSGLQRLLRSGDILVDTGLDRPVVLRDVPRVALVQEALAYLREAGSSAVADVRRQSGAVPLAPEARRSGGSGDPGGRY